VVLAPTQDLVEAAQRLGARDVRLQEPVAPEPGTVTCSAEQVREELALPAGRPIVLAQARLHEDSRLDVLVGAATGWRRVAEVVLVGTGPAYRELVAQATIARAPVTFAGDRAAVAPTSGPQAAGATLEDLLAAATVAVVTDPRARPEFALRAARAGVALVVPEGSVVADVFGIQAVVTVPVGEVDALDEAVRTLLAGAGAGAGVVAAARARLAALPDTAAVAAELARLYERVSLATPAERFGGADTPAGPR
jgi:glycosyltransferase involved in cell wall biosynthesis